MDRSSDNLGQTISNIQRDLEELKSNQVQGGGGGGGGGEEYFAGNGIEIDMGNTISIDTDVVATKTDLDSKQDELTAGSHISISSNNIISATGIPTKTSDLTNDGSDGTSTYAESDDLATVATSGNYNDLTNKPTIPDPTDYYWANMKVSSASSTTTSPTFRNAYFGGSVFPHLGGNGVLTLSNQGWTSNDGTIAIDSGAIRPANGKTTMNIGASGNKWQHLYMSGNIYKGNYTITIPSANGTIALTSELDAKVNVQSVILDNQTTTILTQVKALGAAEKSYGRFACTYDGASANISDKPTGTTNASFVCVAHASRQYTASSYTYQVLCWVQANTNPYRAVVTQDTTAISWERVIPTVNNGTLTVTQNGTTAGTFTANQSSNTTIALTDTTYSDMVGATLSADGENGLVPAPSAGDQDKFLRGDGTWASVTPGGGEDTGWVDLRPYMVSTSVYEARPGNYYPKARRINGIVYLSGEIYCKTPVGVMTSTLLENIPEMFVPDTPEGQANGSGVCYELTNSYYMIYIETMTNGKGRIRISQPYTKIPATANWQGYSLSGISPYPGK